MQEIDNYLQIMIESLEKKSGILDRIIVKNDAQRDCIKDKEYADVNWDAFNVLVAEKETAIEQINEIDEGFEALYTRNKDEILKNKDNYKDKIAKLKELITSLTEKGVKIQAGEDRNRQIIENIFQKTRKDIKKQRTSARVASSYYKTMSNSTVRAAEESTWEQKK